MAPKLMALNKLGALRNRDAETYQMLQEIQQQFNDYVLGEAASDSGGFGAPSTLQFSQTADGTPVVNTTTTTTIVGTGAGSMTIPSVKFKVGATLRVVVRGVAVSPAGDTLSIQFMLGASNVANISAVVVPGVAGSGFVFDCIGIIRSLGASAGIQFIGTALFGGGTAPLIFGTGVAGSFNSTLANLFDVQVTWSAAHPTSTITSKVITLELLAE